ncbi:DUF6065 family protein [soil metagenome]
MPPFTAYITGETRNWTLRPAGAGRAWMDAAPERAPHRCLPLMMANQLGWMVTSPREFVMVWDGGQMPRAVQIFFGDETPGRHPNEGQIGSVFGAGVVTFVLPWLFRTPPGVALLARGPANAAKDGVAPLEGLIETAWSPYGFTMNWKATRAGTHVRFEAGEPICQLLPVRVDLLEELEPRVMALAAEPALAAAHRQWLQNRDAQSAAIRASGVHRFQLDYTRGVPPAGCPHLAAQALEASALLEHRTRVDLKGFTE